MNPVDVLIVCLAACLVGWAVTLAALWRVTRARRVVRRPAQRRRREHQIPAHPPATADTAVMPAPYSPGRAPIQAGYRSDGRPVR